VNVKEGGLEGLVVLWVDAPPFPMGGGRGGLERVIARCSKAEDSGRNGEAVFPDAPQRAEGGTREEGRGL